MYALFAPLGIINLRLFGVPLKMSVNLVPFGGLFPLNTTLVKFLHQLKIPTPKLVTELGMLTLVKLLQFEYLQPIITQYFIDNKSEIWLLFLIAHSKR